MVGIFWARRHASLSQCIFTVTRLICNPFWAERYVSQIRGTNSRLDELQAAILRVKLRYLDQWNDRWRQVAAHYATLLTGNDLILPAAADDVTHVYHLYVVRSCARDILVTRLRERGIGAQIHYPAPIHLQPAYADLGSDSGSLPETERAANEVLSLPLYPEMSETAIEQICQFIQQR